MSEEVKYRVKVEQIDEVNREYQIMIKMFILGVERLCMEVTLEQRLGKLMNATHKEFGVLFSLYKTLVDQRDRQFPALNKLPDELALKFDSVSQKLDALTEKCQAKESDGTSDKEG